MTELDWNGLLEWTGFDCWFELECPAGLNQITWLNLPEYA